MAFSDLEYWAFIGSGILDPAPVFGLHNEMGQPGQHTKQ
jgi:hypothetical protein